MARRPSAETPDTLPARPRTKPKPFEQLPAMFDMGPVVRQAPAPAPEFVVDDLVETSIRRANATAAMYETSRVALEHFKRAIEEAAHTGVSPIHEPGVVQADAEVFNAAMELRAANAAYDRVWQGRELVSLPVEVQQQVYLRSRAARAAKANGRARSRAKAPRRRR